MKTPVLYFLGLFLKIFSALLIVPLIVGRIYGETFAGLESYIYASFAAIVLGFVFMHLGVKRQPNLVESMIVAFSAWIFAVAIGAIPFVYILGMPYIDAYFEAMSGFTTGGITLITSLELVPKSLLFLRAFMQWIGGLGILTLFIALISENGTVANRLFSAESHKAENARTHPNIVNATISLWKVYMILTLLLASILVLLDVSVFDAITHSFTTISTGGFSNYTDSIAHFNSIFVEAVIAVFMLVSGVNFILLYSALEGNILMLLKDFEARLYAGIFAAASFVLLIDLTANGTGLFNALRLAFFYSASVLSTTGFALTEMSFFPEVSIFLFLCLLLVGGSVGSTSGGLKVLRFGTFIKLVSREVKRMDAPARALDSVVINKKIVDNKSILNAATIMFLWFLTIFAGSFVTIIYTDISIFTAIKNMISVVGTTGILFISQAELLSLPVAVKLTYIFSMLAGRLEIVPLLAIFKIRFTKK
ncbi:MAG: TrkH family potassium uptake protein [Candidatus Aenigmarchaeota archaeon]|nr:TrkH family potassium uptake protein [Candidatus Aenigmarchaeota archaeon]